MEVIEVLAAVVRRIDGDAQAGQIYRQRQRHTARQRRLDRTDRDSFEVGQVVSRLRIVDHHVDVVAGGDAVDRHGQRAERRALRPIVQPDVKHRVAAGVGGELHLFEGR